MPILEKPGPAPTLAQLRSDLGSEYAVNGLIGFIFAATGPVAVILTVGTRGGLSESDLASWIFGAFFLNSLISLAFCWRYRQPLVFFWTIPGTVLVGPALNHLSFAQVIGAFHVAGIVMLLLGASGWVRRCMQAVPMPIVMGMVAAVFLRFGIDLVRSLHDDPAIAAPMVAVFIALTAWAAAGRRLPPLVGALLVGAIAIAVLGRFDAAAGTAFELARPNLYWPQWSWQAMLELVVPLVITVLVVQNGQGVAVLDAAGHKAPINAITVACGAGSIATATVGTVSTCLTGPTNAIIASSGQRHRHYVGGLVCATLGLGFGLLSPLFTRLLLAAPAAFIATLAGLAMLRVLQTAFTISFRDRFSLGALVTFVVTVSDLAIANIGAAFWGLVAGFIVSLLLERDDFRALRQAQRDAAAQR
ncbi:MAG TPA: benzoate/H(+) symporter BenE family transporter [Burkholderiaceae bacterium]|nr:benzoate/H(+) symporter BenE family transporter [Burkholderiaceae bacterium]